MSNYEIALLRADRNSLSPVERKERGRAKRKWRNYRRDNKIPPLTTRSTEQSEN